MLVHKQFLLAEVPSFISTAIQVMVTEVSHNRMRSAEC